MRNSLIGFAAAVLMLTGCASGDRVVLTADPDGTVGKIEVANAAGAQLVTAAKTGVSVARNRPPTAPEAVSDETIREVWGGAMSAMPPPPRSFTLYFETGTAKLTEEALRQIPGIIAEARARAFPRVFVAGHADTTGTDEINIPLSRERAEAVSALLVAGGIDAAAMKVSSHGKGNPLIKTADGVPEPRNRRVSVTIQ